MTAVLDFISVNFVRDYPCVRPYILFYIHGQAIWLFFSYVNITKIINSKWPLNGHFEIFCCQKLIRSLADVAEHICQINRRFDENLPLKCANEHFLISDHTN